MSRYNKRIQAINSDEQYESVFEKRGVKKIKQYRTISKTVYEKDVYQSIRTIDYAWSFGDMYFKIANTFYGDPQYWWIIARANGLKGFEVQVDPAKSYRIPIAIQSILRDFAKLNA